MRRIFILIALLAATLSSSAGKQQSKTLSSLLLSCMQVEDVHPDSLEHNIEKLKQHRLQSADPVERAVYAAAIGRYYAERLWVSSRYEQWRDSMTHWYGTALADKALLAQTKARKWKPFVTIGKDEDYFGGDMLNVVWRSMTDIVPRFERDTLSFLPKAGEMIDYYRRSGRREAALLLALDSLIEAVGDPSEEALLRLRDEYADLPLCAEVYLRLGVRGNVPATQQREWLRQGIEKYPRYRNISSLRNALTRLSDPYFRWEGSTDVYPGKTYQWKFRARNIRSVTIDGKVRDFGEHDPVEEFTDSMEWTAPASGDCEVVFVPRTTVRLKDKIKPLTQKFRVSALQAVYQLMPDNSVRLLVLDSETGAPQEGVTVAAYSPETTDTVAYFVGLTDQMGRVRLPRAKNKRNNNWDNRLRFRMSRPGEEHLPITTLYVYNAPEWQGVPKDSTRKLTLFTDRSIYRPGQTVHVSGLAYRQLDWAAQAAPGEDYTLVLYDAMNKKVEEKDVSSDEMGVFAADFVLPTGLRNGSFSIGSGNNRVYFRVEEYKRPTFEIVLDDSLYVQGDSCVVRGRALHYDGTPLRAARVTGTYRWQPARLFYSKVRLPSETRQLDTLETDDRGQFAYTLKIEKEQGGIMPLRRSLSVTVDVLSQQGETHHADNWYWRTYETPLRPEPELVDSAFLVRSETETFAEGQPGRITVTTHLSDVYLYYTLSAAGKVWKDGMVHLNNETHVFTVPYEEKYDQSLTASFCFVKNGQVYSDKKVLYLARPDNRLRPHWDTFRNLLQPGQQEEWRLTLRRPDGTPADANLMVSLYDASLDYFSGHAWNFDVYRSHRTYSVAYRSVWRESPSYDVRAWYNQKRKKETGIRLTAINTSLYNVKVYSSHLYSGRGETTMLKHAKFASAAQMRLAGAAPGVNVRGPELPEVAVTTGAQFDSVEEDAAEMVEEESGEATLRVPMRENFNETAFFYPQLRTDKNGQVAISFTLPESLTRWNLIGIAHTKDMMCTRIGEQIEARKDLMAQLFLPRFLRPGDEAVLVATVRNVSDTVQQGKAVLQVLDAATEKVLKTWKTEVALASKQDTVLHFPYAVADNPLSAPTDLIVRWAVEGTTCSDGEQRLLPVLSPTEQMTNTVAITANEPGVTNIDLSTLFPANVTNRRLTVEYTTRPEQYALQALPALAKAGREDVLSLASAYYAGVLGKNLNVDMPDSTEVYYRKMRELQDTEGGFAWYPQMPASTYLTAEVAYLLTRLHMLTGEKPAQDVHEKATHYLLSQRVDSLSFSAANLRTLYVALWNDTNLSKEERKKVDFLLRLAKKAKPENMGYEGQALLAMVWQKEGEARKARKCVELFRERLVSSPDRGTYIEYPKGSFVSIDRKLHIHVQMMEALQRVMPDSTRLLQNMCRYLLQQKRTQEWTTPVNSANAVFALLTTLPVRQASAAKDLLTLTSRRSTPVNFTAKDDALGYLRDSVLVQEDKLPVRLRLHKFSDGESWGGVFAEYEQPYSQVKAHSTGLSVVQEYPQEVRTGSRYTVRYRITADRDYEYVTLVAPRPAFTEPVNQRSGFGWSGTTQGWGHGLGYYRQVHDATTEFSFHHVPRGEYVIEETLYVERGGRYHSGIAVIRCEYADEFRGHSEDSVVEVNK